MNYVQKINTLLLPQPLFNAVDYGVPQNRERLFVVGHKGNFKFPKPLLKTSSLNQAVQLNTILQH